MADCTEASYFAVTNIPVKFRSANLRNYFSQFIESCGFICFHYRHRPEIQKDTASAVDERKTEAAETEANVISSQSNDEDTNPLTDAPQSTATVVNNVKSCCCVVSVHSKEADRFVKMYSGNQWIDPKGNWLARCCIIKRVRVSSLSGDDAFPYKTKLEQRRRVALSECFTEADLKALPELNPPSLMSAGNVGTPVTVFLQLIQSCRLPPRLIRKLGLIFPKTGSRRRYGNVPYLYRGSREVVATATEENVFTAGGHEICGPGKVPPPGVRGVASEGSSSAPEREEQPEPEEGQDDTQSDADDDDDRCEEWERHEALHEDVTSQERCKERLFEEEIELKWEKGGSGLVFYTDAQYWQEEEGDFDEQTTDDWDVDMGVYYDKDGGDMDSRDFVQMHKDWRLREGLEEASSSQHHIGSFEKFTKGMGRRLMEKQGWKDGDGLGHSQVGLAEALENEGQHPKCKRGFGYHGEKLNSFLPAKKRKDFLISTIYDDPLDIDKGDSLMRRHPTTSLKYREWRSGGTIGPKR